MMPVDPGALLLGLVAVLAAEVDTWELLGVTRHRFNSKICLLEGLEDDEAVSLVRMVFLWSVR